MLSLLFASFLASYFLYHVSPSPLLYWFTYIRMSLRHFHRLFRNSCFGQVGPIRTMLDRGIGRCSTRCLSFGIYITKPRGKRTTGLSFISTVNSLEWCYFLHLLTLRSLGDIWRTSDDAASYIYPGAFFFSDACFVNDTSVASRFHP